MTDWVRLWHDMPTDPKWRVVARKSKQPLPCVLAVFTLMLTNASGNSNARGTLLGWDHEDAGAALDMDAEDIAAIYDAMQGKVLDGDRLTGWERRQPKREDAGVGGRVAKHRAAKANAAERDVTHRNAAERPREDTETDTDIPLANANGAEPEPDQVFWDGAKAFIKPEAKNPGAVVGKWVRDHGKPAVAEAITRAQLERPAVRIPFIEGCFRRRRESAEVPIC